MLRLLQSAVFCRIHLESIGLREPFDDNVGDVGVDPLLLAGDAELARGRRWLLGHDGSFPCGPSPARARGAAEAVG